MDVLFNLVSSFHQIIYELYEIYLRKKGKERINAQDEADVIAQGIQQSLNFEDNKMREKLTSNQDTEYEESVELDRVKKESEKEYLQSQTQKQIEESLLISKLEKEKEEKERKAKEREAKEKERFEKEKEAKKKQVVEQPNSDDSETINIRFRFPNNRRSTRLFKKQHTISNIMDYLMVKNDINFNKFNLVNPYPKKIISKQEHLPKSLADIGIADSKQITLIIEKKK